MTCSSALRLCAGLAAREAVILAVLILRVRCACRRRSCSPDARGSPSMPVHGPIPSMFAKTHLWYPTPSTSTPSDGRSCPSARQSPRTQDEPERARRVDLGAGIDDRLRRTAAPAPRLLDLLPCRHLTEEVSAACPCIAFGAADRRGEPVLRVLQVGRNDFVSDTATASRPGSSCMPSLSGSVPPPGRSRTCRLRAALPRVFRRKPQVRPSGMSRVYGAGAGAGPEGRAPEDGAKIIIGSDGSGRALAPHWTSWWTCRSGSGSASSTAFGYRVCGGRPGPDEGPGRDRPQPRREAPRKVGADRLRPRAWT